MALLREGIEKKNELLFGQPISNYHLALSRGDFSPNFANPATIYWSEISDVRFDPDSITVGWNDTLNRDEIIVDKTVTPTTDLIFNRLFVTIDGRLRSAYEVTFTALNSFDITSPLTNPFQIGDRIIYNAFTYNVDSVLGQSVVVIPGSSAPNTPASGTGTIRDGSGTILVVGATNELVVIPSGQTNLIRFVGSTYVAITAS